MMNKLSNSLIFLVALFHVAVLVLEMFYWNHPIGHSIFGLTPEVAQASEVLAMNQGLYNGFLAAGLFWGLLASRTDIKVFFLVCVVIAGVFGGITAKPTIMLTQGLPALLALVFLKLANRE